MGNNKALKTDEIAQMLNSDDEEAVEVAPAKKRATTKKVQKQMVSTSCTTETVLKHGTEDSLKTDKIAQMLNDDEKEEVPAKKRATRKKVLKQTVEEPKNDKKDQDSEDKEVSFKEGLFNFSRAEDVKKKPIYMRNFSPDKKLKIKPDVFDDLYDMGNIPSDSSQDD